MVLLHINIALLSLVLATYSAFRPTTKLLAVSYALTAGTLATGVYLVWAYPGHMAETCTMGLIYTLITAYSLVVARRKLAEHSNK